MFIDRLASGWRPPDFYDYPNDVVEEVLYLEHEYRRLSLEARAADERAEEYMRNLLPNKGVLEEPPRRDI